MDCPICGFAVADARGLASHFRHQAVTHPDYARWQEDRRYEGKVEGVDFVKCRECGQRADTLARHLKAAHGTTADEYRAKYPEALIRAAGVTARMAEAARQREGGHGKGETKTVVCSGCASSWEGSKFLVPGTHDLRCAECRQEDDAEDDTAQWVGKTEPDDFVTCLECSYRAENLTSHLQHAHPQGYRDRHPEALVVALKSDVRDKSALRGQPLPEVTRQKMSENAGRWNKGLTKETNASLAQAALKMQFRVPWSKGLTQSTDERLARTAEKLKLYAGEKRPWDNGLTADLNLADFQPFMDAEGRVDHHEVMAATGVSWVTVRKYIVDLGLQQSRRYIEDAADDRTIKIEREVLEGFKLANGKVPIGQVMAALGHAYQTVKRECDRHGLPTFHRHLRQSLCLNAVAVALGGSVYRQEWMSRRFTNPKTGWMFKFDGYFLTGSSLDLIVEFHGYQHYTFPNAYMPDESYLPVYDAMLERDRVKKQMIESSGDLKYLEVREDEDFTNVDYLQGRLVALGVLEARGGGLWLGRQAGQGYSIVRSKMDMAASIAPAAHIAAPTEDVGSL